MSPFDAEARSGTSSSSSRPAHEVDLDVHGRILVPPTLRTFAGLEKDVVWGGMGRTIHLWDKAAYEAQMAEELPADQVIDLFAKGDGRRRTCTTRGSDEWW